MGYVFVHTSRGCPLSGSIDPACLGVRGSNGYVCRLNVAERARLAMLTAMGADATSAVSMKERAAIALRTSRIIGADECRATCGERFLFEGFAD